MFGQDVAVGAVLQQEAHHVCVSSLACLSGKERKPLNKETYVLRVKTGGNKHSFKLCLFNSFLLQLASAHAHRVQTNSLREMHHYLHQRSFPTEGLSIDT